MNTQSTNDSQTATATGRSTRGKGMTALAGIACGACLLPSLITLGTFGAIGSAVNGAWLAAAVIGAAVVAIVIFRRRARATATGCGAECGCSSDAPTVQR